MRLADLTPVLEVVADVGHHSLALVAEPHSVVAVPHLTVLQCRAKVCVEDTLALSNVSLSIGANTTSSSSSPISNFCIKVKRIKRREEKRRGGRTKDTPLASSSIWQFYLLTEEWFSDVPRHPCSPADVITTIFYD